LQLDSHFLACTAELLLMVLAVLLLLPFKTTTTQNNRWRDVHTIAAQCPTHPKDTMESGTEINLTYFILI
jgi:hypothetical protein